MKTKKETEFQQYRDFIDSIDANWKGLNKILNDRSVDIKVDLSYRVKSSWDKYGLIDSDRENLEWRRFSLLDAVWIEIIKRLRDFGFPLDSIKKLKHNLDSKKGFRELRIPVLAFAIAYAYKEKNTMLLQVFPNSDYGILTQDLTKSIDKDCIIININTILESLLPEYFGDSNGIGNSLLKASNKAQVKRSILTEGLDMILDSLIKIAK
jgi:DNA-binding transcriptional MerR regulator